ncbi:hypothetical protein K0M31_005404 [Melipona bicolor]|uniref:Uncharacterized protein n=1 Tax=Melipona bicolor TaxID=60889 RepID=A0AA40KMP1_9HYME|nr:hypothetical protein K0M31_005404 [Melipona bicolor]
MSIGCSGVSGLISQTILEKEKGKGEKNELKVGRVWFTDLARQCEFIDIHGNRDLADGLMHIVITRSALLAVTLGRDTGQLASQSQEEAVLTSAFPV